MPQEASNLLTYPEILWPLPLAPIPRRITGSFEMRTPYSAPSTDGRTILDFAIIIPTLALLRETKRMT
jgi:hypothetical protein